MRRPNVTPYSRDYRKPPRFDMGLPPKRRRRWWRKPLLILIVILAFLFAPLMADFGLGLTRRAGEGCWILSITDGDTVLGYCPDTGFDRIRLLEFDTPEFGRNADCALERVWAFAATWILRWHLWSGGPYRLLPEGRDFYERRLAHLAVGSEDISVPMVESGYAKPYAGGFRPEWCEEE